MDLEADFLQWVDKNQLFTQRDNLLLALSGGVDSVVLYELLLRNQFSFSVAHVNYMLRGEASQEDEAFCRAKCEKHKIPFFIQCFDTKKILQKKKISLQMLTRQLRYQWFAELMGEYQFHYLLLAHHADDSLETTLFNLIKGTGLSGLCGITIKKNNIVRPLSYFSKKEIKKFATISHLKWREDISNKKNNYLRNFIRNKIIPMGKSINPIWEKTHIKTMKRMSEARDIITYYTSQIEKKYFFLKSDQIQIDIPSLLTTKINAYILYLILKKYHFDYLQVEEIYHCLLTKKIGKKFISSSHTCLKDRETLFLYPIEKKEEVRKYISQETKKLKIDKYLIIFDVVTHHLNFEWKERNKDIVFLNLSKLVFPLELRYWDKGDYFVPLGMKGRKKISDFLTDEKIPIHKKEKTLVLCSQKNIVWVVGYRINEKYKIDEKTSQILKIELCYEVNHKIS